MKWLVAITPGCQLILQIQEQVLPAKYQQLITGEINRILREMNRPSLEDDKNREETKQSWPSRIEPGLLDESFNRSDLSLGRKEPQVPYVRKDSLASQGIQPRKDSVASQNSTPLGSKDLSLGEPADQSLLRKASLTEFRDEFDNLPVKGASFSQYSAVNS